MGFTAEEDDPKVKPKGPVSPQLTEIITCCLTPVAIIMIAYALFIYLQRNRQMKKKLMGFYQDFWGPVVLSVLVMLVLIFITVVAFVDVVAYPMNHVDPHGHVILVSPATACGPTWAHMGLLSKSM
eukprot:jgi/Botrbrau1/1189/Bobra.0163s0003.1